MVENKTIEIDPLSTSSHYLECLYNGNVLMKATCFFKVKGQQIFLITNWHVVTNKNPKDKTYLSYAVSPEKLKIKVFKNKENIEWDDLEVLLYKTDGSPAWLEHPVFNERVDVVAIPVTLTKDQKVFDIEENIEPYNENTKVAIRDDLFVIGFPFGMTGGVNLPLWKRASIASEPDFDLDDLPKMFVDTATKPGMSGSPVFYKEKRAITMMDGDPGKATKMSRHLMKFVGIYSGRIVSPIEFEAQLGIVWKSSVIDDILI